MANETAPAGRAGRSAPRAAVTHPPVRSGPWLPAQILAGVERCFSPDSASQERMRGALWAAICASSTTGVPTVGPNV